MHACVFIVLFANVVDSASADVVQSLREQVVACWRAGALLENPAAQQLQNELQALKQSHDTVTENGDFTKLAKASRTQTHSCDAVVAQLNALKNDYAKIETAAEEHEDREDPGQLDMMRRLRWILIGLLYKAKHRETEVIVPPVNQSEVVGPKRQQEKCCEVPMCSAGPPTAVANSYCSCTCPDERDCTCCVDVVEATMKQSLPGQPVFVKDITKTDASSCNSQCDVAEFISARQHLENDLHIKHVKLTSSPGEPPVLGCEVVGPEKPQKCCEVPMCSPTSPPIPAKAYCLCTCPDERDCACCAEFVREAKKGILKKGLPAGHPVFANDITDTELCKSQCDVDQFITIRKVVESELHIKHVDLSPGLGCEEYRPLPPKKNQEDHIPEDYPEDYTAGDSAMMCAREKVAQYDIPAQVHFDTDSNTMKPSDISETKQYFNVRKKMSHLYINDGNGGGKRIRAFDLSFKKQANRRLKFIKQKASKALAEEELLLFLHQDAEAAHRNSEEAAIDRRISSMLQEWIHHYQSSHPKAECLVCCLAFRVLPPGQRATPGFHIRLLGEEYRLEIGNQPYAVVASTLDSFHNMWQGYDANKNPCSSGGQSYRDIGNPLRKDTHPNMEEWKHVKQAEYMMLTDFEDCFDYHQAYDAQHAFLRSPAGRSLCTENNCRTASGNKARWDTNKFPDRVTTKGLGQVSSYSEANKNKNCGMNTPCNDVCYEGEVCTYKDAEGIGANVSLQGHKNKCRAECWPKLEKVKVLPYR